MSVESFETSFMHLQAPALIDRAEECSRNGQGVATVMLAVAGVEAMLHDLVGEYWLGVCFVKPELGEKYGSLVPKGAWLPKQHHPCDKEILIFCALKQMEEERKCLFMKVEELYYISNEIKAPKGDAVWQNFSLLKKVRNSVTHPQTQVFSQKSYSDEVEGGPRVLEELARKKLINRPSEVQYGVNYLDLLDSQKFLGWCIETVKNFYQFVLDALPIEGNLTARIKYNMRLS